MDNYYVYILYDKEECKIRYIGVSINPTKRHKVHIWESLNKKQRAYNLRKSKWIRTKKNISYKIIAKGSEEHCYNLEIKLIKKYKISKKLTNTTEGGDKPPKLTELSKKKYLATIEKIRKKALDRIVSKTTRDKMSKIHKKRDTSHLLKFQRGVDNPRAKRVQQLDLKGNFIKEWDYANQAIKALKLNSSAITDCLKGRQKTAGGFIWEYGTDEEPNWVHASFKKEGNRNQILRMQ